MSSLSAQSTTSVCVDKVTGLVGADSIVAGDTVKFRLAYVNHTSSYCHVINMFRVYSKAALDSGEVGSGTAEWPSTPTINRRPYITFEPDQLNRGPQIDTSGGFTMSKFSMYYDWRVFGCDGRGADTIHFTGGSGGGTEGLHPHDSTTAFTVVLITRKQDSGKVICLDTANRFNTLDRWRWIPLDGAPEIDPGWGGPYCYTLVALNQQNCCRGQAGNLDCSSSGLTDISDLVTLIDYLYISFRPVCCIKAANIDGDSEGHVDIADLTSLIDYMYISFTEPAPCL